MEEKIKNSEDKEIGFLIELEEKDIKLRKIYRLWCNAYFRNKRINVEIEDINKDFCDSINLIRLIEAVWNTTIQNVKPFDENSKIDTIKRYVWHLKKFNLFLFFVVL